MNVACMLFLIFKLLILLQLTLYMDYIFVRAEGCDTCCVKQCLPVDMSASIKRNLTYVRSFKNHISNYNGSFSYCDILAHVEFY